MEAAALKRGTVLFVDDERRVLTSMRAMFRRDYEVLLANSGQEAIDLLRDHSVDVIVSDQRMPGMTGVEVLKAVKTLAPNAMRILLTGYADLKAIEASINEGEVFRYLTKPCPSEQLKEAIGLAAEIATRGCRQRRAVGASVGDRDDRHRSIAEGTDATGCGACRTDAAATDRWRADTSDCAHASRAGAKAADGATFQQAAGRAVESAAYADSAPSAATLRWERTRDAQQEGARTFTMSICWCSRAMQKW